MVQELNKTMYAIFKRSFDCISALLLLIVVSPLVFLLALAVRVNLGSPIIFKQERTTKGKRRFNIYKFRTMTDKRNANGELLPDKDRMTQFGSFLRSSSLDELPELVNIIKGDMAVIGPRPLPSVYDDYYFESELPRFDVRSGLVPPDSIDPNPIISWDKQFVYESEYGKSLSLAKDLKIILGVFRILFKRKKEDYGGFVRKSLSVERAKY